MKIQDVMSCSISEWYRKFRKCTITSELLDIPSEVLDYLLDTGTLVLPPASENIRSTTTASSITSAKTTASYGSSDDDDDDNEYNDKDWSTVECTSIQAPGLEEFSNRIRRAIARLGGKVFPKLNWTAPKDACWMSYTNSLECCTPADVYLLLKSSNLIHRDLTHPFQHCSDESSGSAARPVLVLRRWREINPSAEFRCFVTQGKLLGFCSRDVSQHYTCLGMERSSIVSDINSFWLENIDNRFPLRNYVFDCVRFDKHRVVLIDFSPLDKTRTNALLFDWDELCTALPPPLPPLVILQERDELGDLELEICDNMQTMNLHNTEEAADSNRVNEALVETVQHLLDDSEDDLPEFRYINSETGVQPNHDRMHGLPVDFLDLCSGKDPNKLIDLMQLKVQSSAQDDTSDDEGT
uniref:Cell division cycle protein 123 homolog n=1 Tax=Hirondellea gigas TaxID=1518452 RepID=A0A2P2I1L5_9CRUS